jgi:hypothetical protein
MISNYTYKPLVYYVITFIITYALWFAGAYVSFHEEISHLTTVPLKFRKIL